ncbi:hypothetical protein RQN30_00995 [Arcanobacterium hippocoleae]
MSENLTREIAEYRSKLLKIDEYKIELDVSEAKMAAPNFAVSSTIVFDLLNRGTFILILLGRVSRQFM